MPIFLNTLRILVTILPSVAELVKTLELAIPLRGAGVEKLQLLKDILSDTYNSLEDEVRKGISLEGLVKAAVALANRIVQLFNKLGWPTAPA